MVIEQRLTGINTVDETIRRIYEVLERLNKKLNKLNGIYVEVIDGVPVFYMGNWRFRELTGPTRLFIEYDANEGVGDRNWIPEKEMDPLT